MVAGLPLMIPWAEPLIWFMVRGVFNLGRVLSRECFEEVGYGALHEPCLWSSSLAFTHGRVAATTTHWTILSGPSASHAKRFFGNVEQGEFGSSWRVLRVVRFQGDEKSKP
jgi:hypothetical protein